MIQSEQQYEQLLMQYQQLLQGAEDISVMIDKEDYDSAITMIKSREKLLLSCKCIRNYLELTPIQQKEIDKVFNDLKQLELNNIKKLQKGIDEVQQELTKTQKSQKLQQAYGSDLSESTLDIEK